MPKVVSRLRLCAATALLSLVVCSVGLAQTGEYRAFWVDAFHAGFMSSNEVTTLIDRVRAANCNTVVVEVRKRGDAYYNGSIYEPHATGTTPTNFDSLADLIAKAHDTSGGKQRLEVHAWLVSFKIWGSQTPPPDSIPPHPYNAHPEWLTQDDTGAQWDGSYTLDPGHPEVQQHTLNVCLDILSRYDIDGLNFDYIRYSENRSSGGTNHWGYNPVAIARFNTLYGKTGQPALNDPDWNQFRREQITGFVRKVYLHALALKPHVKISADTITWAPSVTSDTSWTNSARAYRDVLQDWRSWMEEGILDLNIPMNYFRHNVSNYARDYTNWMNFAKDHRFDRHVIIGPGIYLNAASNAIVQMRATRALSPAGNPADGVCGYSYAVPNSNTIAFAAFHTFLTNSPNAQDPLAPPIFAQKVPVPSMPWKTSPTAGHLKGTIYGASSANPLDGAGFSLTGPVAQTRVSDGNGFYGVANLPPGDYTLSAWFNGYGATATNVTIVPGSVATVDLVLPAGTAPVFAAHPQGTNALIGMNVALSATVTGAMPLSYQWAQNETNLLPFATNCTLVISNLIPAHAGAYTLIATNSLGAATSNPARLGVYGSPAASLHSPAVAPNAFSFSVAGVPGFSYTVQASTNLADWMNLATNQAPFLLADTNAPLFPYRFYRAFYLP